MSRRSLPWKDSGSAGFQRLASDGKRLSSELATREAFARLRLFLIAARGRIHGNIRLAKPGWRPLSVGFNPPEEPHASRIDVAGARFFIIELDLDWLERARSHAIPLVASATFREGPLSWLGVRLYKEFRFPDEVSHLVAEAVVLEMMAEYARQLSPRCSKPRRGYVERTSSFDRGLPSRLHLPRSPKHRACTRFTSLGFSADTIAAPLAITSEGCGSNSWPRGSLCPTIL